LPLPPAIGTGLVHALGRFACVTVLALGCATTGGSAPSVALGCSDRVSVTVTTLGFVTVSDRARTRRAMVRSEQREDLDRLLFAVGVNRWPACPESFTGCGLRYIDASGSCSLAPRGAVASSAGQSLMTLLGDVVEAELGPGRRGALQR
jgi:hypothetical protein